MKAGGCCHSVGHNRGLETTAARRQWLSIGCQGSGIFLIQSRSSRISYAYHSQIESPEA